MGLLRLLEIRQVFGIKSLVASPWFSLLVRSSERMVGFGLLSPVGSPWSSLLVGLVFIFRAARYKQLVLDSCAVK